MASTTAISVIVYSRIVPLPLPPSHFPFYDRLATTRVAQQYQQAPRGDRRCQTHHQCCVCSFLDRAIAVFTSARARAHAATCPAVGVTSASCIAIAAANAALRALASVESDERAFKKAACAADARSYISRESAASCCNPAAGVLT